ncbi:unnamed protein product [Urochloa humidicola]
MLLLAQPSGSSRRTKKSVHISRGTRRPLALPGNTYVRWYSRIVDVSITSHQDKSSVQEFIVGAFIAPTTITTIPRYVNRDAAPCPPVAAAQGGAYWNVTLLVDQLCAFYQLEWIETKVEDDTRAI